MKKILTLVCAVALVAGANAQVKQARQVGAPLSKSAKMEAVSPLMMDQAKGAAKAAIVDTLWAEAAFHSLSGSIGGGYTATGISSWDDVNNIPTVWWPYGTGWANNFAGSGEYGLLFDVSSNGWLSQVMQVYVNDYYVTGAMVYICRARTTATAAVDVNNTDMPLYYKLYTSDKGQVTEQKAWDNLMEAGEGSREITVHYPVNTKDYASISNTIGVPLLPTEDPDQMMAGQFCSARFETPSVAGDYFCVSMVFPNDQEETDTLWNATALILMEPGTTTTLQSEEPGAVYLVWDAPKQNMWGHREGDEFIYAREREELEWMLPRPEDQNDETAIIAAMRGWVFDGGSALDGEPYMRVILASEADVERGAAYDKYVEVKINPAIDFTEIVSADRIQKVEIYNTNGKLVKTQVCDSNIETIALNGLTSGMYIAKVTTIAGVANKKIMVR